MRFPGFEEDWERSSVEKNCLIKGRIGYRGYTTEDLVEKDKGALVLGGKHIKNQAIDLSEPTFLSWDKYYESPEIMVEVGDIIFSQRGTLGDCAIIENEIGSATINPSMVLLKEITCNPKFLYYILIGDVIQNEVQKNKALGAIPMLSQKQIKAFSFLLPKNPNEQTKIASFLSLIDERIQTQIKIIEELKLLKNTLSKKIFSQQLKFKDGNGNDFSEWEVRKVGDVFTVTRGNVLAMNLLSNDYSEKMPFPVYSSQTKNKGLAGYYNDFLFENAITWTTDGANAGDVNYRSGKFYCTNVCGVLIDQDGYANICIAELINSVSQNYVSYVGNPKLMNGVMSEIAIPFPSIQEQEKISKLFLSISAKIDIETELLQKLEEQKKYLLANMFI